jgi:hypothetical protein
MRIFVMGGTGFIGSYLIPYLLESGHDVTALTRSEAKAGKLPETCSTASGDPLASGPWQREAARCDAIVNLVGKNIFTRWTEKTKHEIIDTRVRSTMKAVQALKDAEEPKPCLFNANAVGYYPTDDRVHTEEDPPGGTFLAEVSVKWQQEAQRAEEFGARVVIGRFAPPLAREGGVLATMLPVFRMGIGGRVGSGRQPFPWIHMRDMVRGIEFCIRNASMNGPVNLCAPKNVSNAEFTRALASALKRPAVLPVPGFGLRVLFGQLSEMLVEGPWVAPQKLRDAGFEFLFPEVGPALQDILSRQ